MEHIWLEESNPSYSPFDGSPETICICKQCGYRTGNKTKFCPQCGDKKKQNLINGGLSDK